MIFNPKPGQITTTVDENSDYSAAITVMHITLPAGLTNDQKKVYLQHYLNTGRIAQNVGTPKFRD